MNGQHEYFMRQAIALADQARKVGNHPFGALLVSDNEVVLTAENTVMTGQNVTYHAEMNLVSQASHELPPELIVKSILYTSTEPCAMCAGAIYWAGIPAVVFGCATETLAKMTTGSLMIPCRDIFRKGQIATTIIGPVLEDEARLVHEGFW